MDTIMYQSGNVVITLKETLIIIGVPILFVILNVVSNWIADLEAKANKNDF